MSEPFHNPFGALGRLRDSLPAAPEPPVEVSKSGSVPRAASTPGGPARAVVRMERSGRGGKEVTVIDHLGLQPVAMQAWLKALKTSLGCGGVIEGDALVLQGDHRERLPALLSARGVRRVTVS